MKNIFKDNAIKLFEIGFKVIPLKPNKQAFVKWKKFIDEEALTRSTIIKWSEDFPNANIGIHTSFDFVVVDVDGKEGVELLKKLKPAKTLTVITKKGYHLYYKTNKKYTNRTRFASCLDLRAHGGYVVAPPSMHESGVQYKWNKQNPKLSDMVSLPECIIGLLDVPKTNPEVTKGKDVEVDGVKKGERNVVATKMAGRMASKGMTQKEIYVWLRGWNLSNDPPLKDYELKTVADSIYEKEQESRLKKEDKKEDIKPCTIEECKEVVNKWLYFPQDSVVDLVLACTLSVLAKDDPVWLLLVSAPSMGKTELLRALKGMEYTYYIGSVTRNTFFSGLKNVKGILEKLGHCKLTLINKDFSSVLTMPSFDRVDLLGQMRDIYDGCALKEFGNGKIVNWEGKLNYIAGVTPDIENHYSVIRALGERFMYYRLPEPTQTMRHTMLDRSKRMESHADEARNELKHAMQGVLIKYGKTDISKVTMDERLDEWLREMVNLTTIMRTYVSRDSYTREMIYRPVAEGPARVYKAIRILLKTLAVIRGRKEVDVEDYDIAVKICLDSIPSLRRETLRALMKCKKPEGERAKATAERTKFQSTQLTKLNLDDLSAVGLVDRVLPRQLDNEGEVSQTASHLYKVNREMREKMSGCGIDILL